MMLSPYKLKYSTRVKIKHIFTQLYKTLGHLRSICLPAVQRSIQLQCISGLCQITPLYHHIVTLSQACMQWVCLTYTWVVAGVIFFSVIDNINNLKPLNHSKRDLLYRLTGHKVIYCKCMFLLFVMITVHS